MSEAAAFRERARRIASRARRSPDVRELWGRLVYTVAGTPERRDKTRHRALVFGPPLLAALGFGAWMLFRPVPQPDYKTARMDSIFNYTLLTDEFNRLPVEKRMELIGQLVQRLSDMSAGDSALLGAFAGGIAGAARQQIEENVSRLAIDLWDKHAANYNAVPPEQRAEFLDNVFVEYVRTFEALDGKPTTKTDEQLLGEAKRQSDRDRRALADGRGMPPPEALGRTFGYLRYNVGSHASPAQKVRGQLMLRDMVRHFREGP